jgi:ABC-type phosphate transport system substrate-binding protein
MALLRKTLLLLALLAATSVAAPQSSYRVVVNRANAATTLDRSYASRLFLKKVSAWPDGRVVAIVDQERQSPARQAFSREVHQRDADSVAAYWQTQVFAGRDVPPPIAKSDADVIAFVQANPGAIGYVSAEADTGGVKVLTVR